MSGSTHLALGAAAGAAVAAAVEIHPVAGAAVGALGGLLPDLDAEESYLKHWRPLRDAPLPWVLRSFKPFWLPAVLVSSMLRHRAAFHSLAVGAGLALTWWFFSPSMPALALAIGAGFFSHLVADSMTAAGIAWFWPWRRRLRLLPRRASVRVGGEVDGLFGVAGWVAAAVVIAGAV